MYNADMRNQKTLIALSVAVVAILIALAIQTIDTTDAPGDLRAPGTLTTQPNTPRTVTEEDTDGDGLKDWEEVLWKTDPENADTDGDGTEDGQEVADRRDPTLPGPDDQLAIAEETDTGTASEEQTRTEEFATTFFSAYVEAQAQGYDLSGESLDLLTESGFANYEQPTLYTSMDIRVSNDASETAVHTYGNAVGDILLRNAPGTSNELIILLEATEQEDGERLQDLLITAGAYEANARDLLAVPAPQGATQNHLRLINGFAAVAHDLRAIAKLYSDSLVAAQGLQSYFETSEVLIGAIDTLQAYLESHTSFSQNEGGWEIVNNL